MKIFAAMIASPKSRSESQSRSRFARVSYQRRRGRGGKQAIMHASMLQSRVMVKAR
jgi:hypothetical protein